MAWRRPRFETSDPRSAWLSRMQAVGKGVVHENLFLEYERYEMVRGWSAPERVRGAVGG